jgi:hypothetical protein
MFPNWTGGKQVRYCKLEANKLISPPRRSAAADRTSSACWCGSEIR